MANKHGVLITLEGIEGVGKSSHLPFIANFIEQKGQPVTATREPGGTPLGEALRGVLLNDKTLTIADDSELLMMFAARAEHLAQVIRPAMVQGHNVICDRFTDSTYAYQGGGRGISLARISTIETWVQQGLQPHLTLLFDAPVEVALGRAAKRSAKDRIEDQALSFFEKVRQCFLDRAKQYPERFRIIDANQPYAAVEKQVEHTLSAFF